MPILSLFAFVSMIAAALGVGRPIYCGLSLGEDDRLSRTVWSIALGLVAIGMVLTALGLLGLLYVPLIGVLTLITATRAMVELLSISRSSWTRFAPPAIDEGQWSNDDDSPWPPPARWLSRAMLAAAGVACIASLIAALAPPIAGDALCYHLELPKTFLADHRLEYLPFHENSTFPLLTEMWYLWALALDGGTCAQLVHWGLGVLLALATVVLATPILGRPWAWAAGAMVVLTPGVNNQMTAPLNDVALAATATLALAAWWRAVVNDEGPRWFLVAGLMAGAALGTKYLALVLAAALAAVWTWILVRQPARRTYLLQGAAVMLVLAVSVGGLWYVRAAWHRGNPVYPFFSEILPRSAVESRGDRVLTDDAATATETETPDRPATLRANKTPLGRSLRGLVFAPWELTMHPDRLGGRAHQLGLLLPIVLPGLLLSRRLRGLGVLLGVASGYFVLWYLLRQNVRFLFPVVPPLAVAAAWVWIELRRMPDRPRRVAVGVFAAVIAAMAVLPCHRARDAMAVASGLESREDYLIRHEPTYPAAAVVSQLLPPESHLLSQDSHAFYFNCRVTRENTYRRATHYDCAVTDPALLSDQLRSGGFTHLLLVNAIAGQGIDYDPTLERLVDAQLAGRNAEGLCTLTEYRFQDGEGAVRHYRLIALR